MPYTSKSSTERCSCKKIIFLLLLYLFTQLRNFGVSKGDSEDLRKLRVTTVEYFFTNSRYIKNVSGISVYILPLVKTKGHRVRGKTCKALTGKLITEQKVSSSLSSPNQLK